ncbi:hypothetical protein GCM10027169_23360 [Gordonia jinhuaensis]|uniref:Uncharacterized protein n=1 Tax=Gordonia jinhuaensis TaxID=1517702 RepID=A0A916WZ07_9ACTN|nr:hypothetical protein [Gordonia jinhuaensis]GGB41076.1 hypothetical protein GCM10011489_30820 [Gordonia jinhuaensis]
MPHDRRTHLAVALVVALLTIAMIVTAALWITDRPTGAGGHADGRDGDHVSPLIVGSQDPGDPAPAPVTSTVQACPAPPAIIPVRVTFTDRGLSVLTAASSACSGGDVLSNSHAHVTLRSPSVVIAAADFDLSGAPVVIPAIQRPQRTITLNFPDGSFYQLPAEIDQEPESTLTITTRRDGVSADEHAETARAAGPVTLTATTPHPSPDDHADAVAARSLDVQADADRSRLVADHWFAELSTRRAGETSPQGRWDHLDILDETVEDMQRYPDIAVVHSRDWSVFDDADRWITLSARPFDSAHDALDWCRNHHLDADRCWAQLLSHRAPPQGSAVVQGG